MNSYTLNIYVKESGEAKSAPVSPTSAGETSEKSRETGFLESAKKIMKVAHVGYALNVAKQLVVAEQNRVAIRTGHQLLQEKINYTYGQASKAIALGAATVGALASGNAPLAAVTLATGLISHAVNYSLQSENLRIQKTVEDIGIAEANIRAGAGANRRSRAE